MELKTQQIDEMSIGEFIREDFLKFGGGSTEVIAQRCIDHGILGEEGKDVRLLRSVQADVRRALKVMDSEGLPFAGRTDEVDEKGNPVWEQRAMWGPEAYAININDLRTRAETITSTADKLESEGVARFGALPLGETIAEQVAH